MSKLQIYRDAAEKFRFRLRAGNNRIVPFGEAYEQRASCLNGIRSVQRNCGAPVEDLTVEGGPKLSNPKYQVFQDAKGKFRFHLKAANGEILAQGEGYESKEACFNGIQVVRGCRDAEIEDSTPSTEELKDVEVSVPEILSPAAPLDLETHTKVESLSHEVALKEMPKQASFSTADMTPKESYPWESKLELYAVPQDFSKGTHAKLYGKLSSTISGRGVPGAKIRIYERDKSILGDDYLAFERTNEDGSSNINWKARPLTWRKNTGNIYAAFAGNDKAKPSKSEIRTVSIT